MCLGMRERAVRSEKYGGEEAMGSMGIKGKEKERRNLIFGGNFGFGIFLRLLGKAREMVFSGAGGTIFVNF